MLTLFSCRQDVQIAPTLPDETASAIQTFTSNSASAEEINSIKEWYESLPVTQSLNCSAVTHNPRWDKSKKGSDRVEFEIFENVNKIPVPRLPAANAKKGAKRFVTKDMNGNGNGNANGNNRKGAIVSYIPFNSFSGNMDDVTTSTFRYMQFDGIIMFHEVSGCYIDSYLIEKGVVMKKLKLTTEGLGERCGYTLVQDWYQVSTLPSGIITDPIFIGSNVLATVGCDINLQNSIESYDQTMANNQSSSGNAANGSYGDYLEPSTVKSKDRICPISFTFQTVADPTSQATRLEAGLKNGGVTFNALGGGTVSFQFNHVTFGIPLNSPAYPNGISTSEAADVTARAANLALIQVQQRIMTGGIIGNLNDNFWSAINLNIQNSLRIPLSNVGPETFHTLGSFPQFYIRNDGTRQTIVYNTPTTGC
jgi:hypothetical protein